MDVAFLQGGFINGIFILMLVAFAGFAIYDTAKKFLQRRRARNEENSLLELFEDELPEDKYIIIEAPRVMTKMGKSRLDYAIVSIYGIFCFEFRAYYKHIQAPEYGKTWAYATGIKANYFTSHLWQSKVHICSLKELIGDKPGLNYYAMAAFPNICQFKEFIHEPTSFVGRTDEIIDWILDKKEECLTWEEVQAIARLIEENSKQVPSLPNPEPLTELPDEYKAFTIEATEEDKKKVEDYLDDEEFDPEDEDDEEYDDDDYDEDEYDEDDEDIVEELVEEAEDLDDEDDDEDKKKSKKRRFFK